MFAACCHGDGWLGRPFHIYLVKMRRQDRENKECGYSSFRFRGDWRGGKRGEQFKVYERLNETEG